MQLDLDTLSGSMGQMLTADLDIAVFCKD